MDILRLDLKNFDIKIKHAKSKKKIVTDTILNSESPFVLFCKKFYGEKALSSFFKQKILILYLGKNSWL